jgi:hypothetical protein
MNQSSNGREGYASVPAMDPDAEPLLESPVGRENDYGAADQGTPADDEVRRPEADAHTVGEVTGHHDPGTGAEETEDGFDDYEEAVRHGSEDLPTGTGLEDRPGELPVFEQRLTEPKTVDR